MALKSSNNGQFTLPAMPAGGTVATSGSANVYGSYAQMTASTNEADYIVGLMVTKTTGTSEPIYVAIAIATGGSGSESIVWTEVLPCLTNAVAGSQIAFRINFPVPVPIANATRIAVKTADDVGAIGWKVTLLLCKQADWIDAGINESADLQTIKTQAVTCAAPVTVSANVGTSQAMVFNANNLLKVSLNDVLATTLTETDRKSVV